MTVRICEVSGLAVIVFLLSACGPSSFYQYKNKSAPKNTVVLMIKEKCKNEAKGHVFFYRINGRLILRNENGYKRLWLNPGQNRVTIKFVAKGEAYRYVYTSFADLEVSGEPGESYAVRYKRVKFKKVNIWLERMGPSSPRIASLNMCKQHNYIIPRDWSVY